MSAHATLLYNEFKILLLQLFRHIPGTNYLICHGPSVFYLKFFEHPSFGQVAHEIYPSEWKVHSSEISITIMYC